MQERRIVETGQLTGWRRWSWLVPAAAVVAVDQFTKEIALDRLSRGAIQVVGPVWFRLTFNRGVAFGLAGQWGWPVIAFVAVAVAVLVKLALRARDGLLLVGLGLVIGGALSNLGDRLFRARGVVDFIAVGFWPAFNLADAAVVVGCVMCAFWLIRQ